MVSTCDWEVGRAVDFDWDPNKAKTNLAKHDVAFEEAEVVFADRYALIEDDDGNDFEVRWRIIGLSASKILFVVYTEIEDDVVRIISARKATRHEQNRYYRQAPSQG